MNTTAMSKNKSDKDIEDNKVIAALGYIWILCLVPLLLKRNSDFAQFHAKQGLVLFVMEVVGWLIFWLPLVGWLIFLFIVVLAAMGIANALQGRYWEMPVLGKYARKLNL